MCSPYFRACPHSGIHGACLKHFSQAVSFVGVGDRVRVTIGHRRGCPYSSAYVEFRPTSRVSV